MKIPLVILSFNQPTYLKQLALWWRFFHPDKDKHPIYVFDNGSTSREVIRFVKKEHNDGNIWGCSYSSNNFIPNLTDFINREINGAYEYYCLSDCDILPSPSTPHNYLDIFKGLIESGYHHAGFGLITDDLPPWLNEREMIIGNENELLKNPVEYAGHSGFKAPLDTTFCMYTTQNSGWYAPMDGRDWGNCVRMFKAFHLGWYVDGDHLNSEQEFYFRVAKYRVTGQPSAGMNNNRPKQYQ